jgi:hypothetical protein
VPVRVEGLAGRVERLDAGAGEGGAQLAEGEDDALLEGPIRHGLAVERGAGVDLGRGQGALEAVDDGDQPSGQLCLSAGRGRLRLRRHPLAVVLEVGLGALGELKVLVPFPLEIAKTRKISPGRVFPISRITACRFLRFASGSGRVLCLPVLGC